jgi:hypothetical protein
MPEMNLGKWLVIAGLVLIVIGLLVTIGGRLGLGRLPGDFRYRSDNVTFYFPLATCILVSILLSLLLWIIHRISR